jgi:DNA-3-methyladenine glycosylase II
MSASTVLAAQTSRVLLSEEFFSRAVGELAQRDADLAAVVEKYGRPPLWVREPGFPTLVYIILEQQVSLASARALYQRLQEAVRPFTPGRFLKLTEDEMRRLGFSRQKAHYTRLLADAIQRRQLDLRVLHDLHDHHAREKLLTLKGIGPWTADIYLLSALRRPDIWPIGDLALATAVQEVKRLRKRPSPEKLEKMSAPWRPWRAVAARLFWHAYLCKRGQNTATVSL